VVLRAALVVLVVLVLRQMPVVVME